MEEQTQVRRRRTRWDSGPGMVAMGFLLGVAGILIAAGSYLLLTGLEMTRDQQRSVVFCTTVLTGAALLASLVLSALGIIRWALIPYLIHLKHQNDRIEAALGMIYDGVRLSDTAKMIGLRENERQVLGRGIDQMIARGEFDAALAAAGRLGQLYGDDAYAEQLRRRVQGSRVEKAEQEVDRALAAFEDILERHDWEAAAQEAARLEQRFPNSQRMAGLVERVRQVREQYKHQLERRFLEASRRDEVDASMTLLKELDRYLTEKEAEQFREAARGVISKKRENLAVQFKIAVHDQEWAEAVRVGQEIVESFPNSKMAEEVRGKLDVLRERAQAGQR